MPRKSNIEAIATLGIDIGKNFFHLIGLDHRGAIVLRQRLTRSQLWVRLANLPICLISNRPITRRSLMAASLPGKR